MLFWVVYQDFLTARLNDKYAKPPPTSDEPEITVDKSVVHGGLGEEAVISCIVYGEPSPSVRWYRETMVLDRNGNRMMELFGDR